MVEIAKYIVHPLRNSQAFLFTSKLHDEVPRALCYPDSMYKVFISLWIWHVNASCIRPKTRFNPWASCYPCVHLKVFISLWIWCIDASHHTPASGPRHSSNLSPVPIYNYSFNISSYPKSCVKSLPSGYLSITFDLSLFRLIFWHVKIKSFAFTDLTSDMEQIFLDFSFYECLLFSLFFHFKQFLYWFAHYQ